MQRLIASLTSWIKEKVIAANGRGVVVGMSGGVDSSAVAVLCQFAFPHSTLRVVMPCYSNKTDEIHAKLVAGKFGIVTKTIVLDEVLDSLLEILSKGDLDIATKKLAQANLKPRLRMVVLYYLANCLGYLVVGASNKSELSIGYFTKYGDGAADLFPLGNLFKTQIYELATYLDIPREIVSKPPSAGLWAGQTDEVELGLTYTELDQYLATGEAGKELRQKIDSMINENSHKRSIGAIPDF